MAEGIIPVNESLELTGADRAVLRVFLDEGETAQLLQQPLARAAGLGPAGAFLTLTRLADAGWLVKSVQEQGDVTAGRVRRGTPSQTCWKLTPDGTRLAREALNR